MIYFFFKNLFKVLIIGTFEIKVFLINKYRNQLE